MSHLAAEGELVIPPLPIAAGETQLQVVIGPRVIGFFVVSLGFLC